MDQAQRQTEPQIALERERRLNAVLRAIRNVNHLIIREKERNRLLQEACETLAETPASRCVWIIGLTPDGRVQAAVEAGIGTAFTGVRAQCERGELPECCRRALASESPIVMADPVTHCIACPVAPQYRDGTVGMAVAMRHGDKVYGVLVAALPTEMANDAGEFSLFCEVAGDLAFALHDLEQEQQHKRTEEALRKSDTRYRRLVDTAIVGVYETSLDGTILYANEAMATILERDSAQQLLHTKVQNLYKDPNRREELLRTLRGAGKSPAFEATMLTSRGNERHVLLEATLKGDSIQGMMVDITERKRTEEALRRSEENFRRSLDDSPLGIRIVNADGEAIYTNQTMLDIYGYSNVEELRGIPAERRYTPESYSEHQMRKEKRLRGEYVPSNYEVTIVRKDGTIRRLDVSRKEVLWNGHTEFQVLFADVTERKRAEDALIASNRLLEEAMAQMKATEIQIVQQERLQALGQMASGIAHDFNNSLTPILGYSQMLLAHPENLQDVETVKGYLETINLAARDAATVVGRLRDFYRAPETTDIFAPVSLDEIVGQAISLTQAKWKDQAQANGITINIETELGCIPPIPGNQAELREALANLILNAVDAMPNGGKITLSTRREQDHAILAVSDTGTGMTEEVRQRCLEPFFTTKREQGTGMGLPAVYGTVQRHGGTLEIESEVGKGSTFTIRLPVTMPKRAERDLPKPVASHLHILVADDQPMVRQLISEFLLADGHTIEAVANGKEALEKFTSGRFDLVVTDRAMPEMSGDQLALAIKKVAPSMPVILLSGVGDILQDNKEKPEGVDVVLGKPPDLTALRRAIRSCLPSRRGDEP